MQYRNSVLLIFLIFSLSLFAAAPTEDDFTNHQVAVAKIEEVSPNFFVTFGDFQKRVELRNSHDDYVTVNINIAPSEPVKIIPSKGAWK